MPVPDGQEKPIDVEGKGFKEVDLKHMTRSTRQLVVDRALKTDDQDNESFLLKYKERVQRFALGYARGRSDFLLCTACKSAALPKVGPCCHVAV